MSLISHSSHSEMGILTSHLTEHGKLRKTEPKAQKSKKAGKCEQMGVYGAEGKASEVKTWVPQGLTS